MLTQQRWSAARVTSARQMALVACILLCILLLVAPPVRSDPDGCVLAPHASALLEFNLAVDAAWDRRHVHAVEEVRAALEAIEGPVSDAHIIPIERRHALSSRVLHRAPAGSLVCRLPAAVPYSRVPQIVVLSFAGASLSGKSFLANQLLPFAAPEDSFALTRPEHPDAYTQDVSLYVVHPCAMAGTALSDTTIVYVDSPGLFRRDRASAFDAQILSVLHLLSSTMLWTSSSPVIDQAQLLALDLALEEGAILGALTKPHLVWTITSHPPAAPTADSNAAAQLSPLAIDAQYLDRMLNLTDSGATSGASSAVPQLRSHFRQDFKRFFASTTTVALPPPLAPSAAATGAAESPAAPLDPSAPGAHLSAEYRIARDELKAALWRSFDLQQDREATEPDTLTARARRRRRKKAPQAKQLADGTPINGRLLSAVVGVWAEQLTNSTAPIRAALLANAPPPPESALEPLSGPSFLALVISREADRMRAIYRSAMPPQASLPVATSILVASHRTARALALKGYGLITKPGAQPPTRPVDPAAPVLPPSARWLLALDADFSAGFSALSSLNAGMVIQAFDSGLMLSTSLLAHALGRLTLPTQDLFITTYREDALAKWGASIDRIRHLDEDAAAQGSAGELSLVREYTARFRAEVRAQVRTKREQNRDRTVEQKTNDARREFRELEWTALKAIGQSPPGPPAAFVDDRTKLALLAGNVTEEIDRLIAKLTRRFSDDLTAMEISGSQGSDPSVDSTKPVVVREDDEGLLSSDDASDLMTNFEHVVRDLARDMRRKMDSIAEDRRYKEKALAEAQADRCLSFARLAAQRVQQAAQSWSTPEGALWRFSAYIRTQVAIGSEETAIFCARNEDGSPAETISPTAVRSASDVAALFTGLESKLLSELAFRAEHARSLVAIVWLLSLWSLSTVFRILRRLRRGSKVNHALLPLQASAGSPCAAPWSLAATVVHALDAVTWVVSLPLGAAAAIALFFVPECTSAPTLAAEGAPVSLQFAAASSAASSSPSSFSSAAGLLSALPSAASVPLSSLSPSSSVGFVLCLVGWLACVSGLGLWEFRARRAQAQINKLRASE